MSVAPSKLGTQPVGEAAEVAEGVFQLKLPVPFPLGFVASYLVEGASGWTIIDTGFDYPAAREAWGRGAEQAGIDLSRDVDRIIVTHFHPDHIGLSRWLGELAGAPVHVLEGEIRHAREVWEGRDGPERFVAFLARYGMAEEMARKAADQMRSSIPLPEKLWSLHAGEEISLGGGKARVLHVPGHADYQVALHDEARGILFAADHVMLGITPNVGLWPDSQPRPLFRYLESLKNLRGLDADLVLPGHGPLFHDLEGRIDELLQHHAERLEEMRVALQNGPRTPYEVSRALFRGTLSVYERAFALAETLAHLEHLALTGRAERVEGDAIAYRAS